MIGKTLMEAYPRSCSGPQAEHASGSHLPRAATRHQIASEQSLVQLEKETVYISRRHDALSARYRSHSALRQPCEPI